MPKWRNWQTRTFEGRGRYLVGVRVPPSAPIKNLSVANKELSQTTTPSLSQLRHSNNSFGGDFRPVVSRANRDVTANLCACFSLNDRLSVSTPRTLR